MDSGRNGRHRLFLPPGLNTGEAEPEGVTMEEWARKADRAVNRAELLAVLDAYLMTKVKGVMAYVLDKRVAQLRGEMVDLILKRERARRTGRWYRRLWRWIATFGHPTYLVQPEAPQPASVAAALREPPKSESEQPSEDSSAQDAVEE